MTHNLPPCDIEALLTIEAVAPHLLTAHDRHCLRAWKAAPVVQRTSYLGYAVCALGLAILAAWGFAA